MENVMTNGFAELSVNEMEMIDGGWNWGTVLGGAALVVGCIGVAASGPVGWAGAAALCGASGLGGAAVGWGMTN